MGEPSPYRAVLASRVRAQFSYRVSFASDVVANVAVGVSEFAVVYVVFSRVDTLGGLDVWQAALVFALANLTFALADLAVGHLDRLPRHLRAGTLDAFLLRPASLLGQLATSEVSLKRLGRVGVALAVLVVALPRTDAPADLRTAALLVTATVGGTAVFAAVFVLAGALQFWLVEGAEAVNSITYGGSNAASYPASVFPDPLRWAFTYVVPATFVAYLPVLTLLGLPGPAGSPSWLGWCSPAAALVVAGVAGLAWRAGVRYYTGAGS
ncbi:ABC transporter permease [Kineococcus sp. R8]|uniref:ABC-2 family transporter protein n=1 Tax=Kineococcus siccus TaxID=2696567 RepID=UPI0014120313|nr:ABC transporter permease [Kineococcus siccus]